MYDFIHQCIISSVIMMLSVSQISAKSSVENVIKVDHVIEDGFEHPNAHFEGFVLSDVFVQHTAFSPEAKPTHVLTQRKLQFNDNPYLRNIGTSYHPLVNDTSGYSLFSNLTEEISSLDASSDLSRLKVRALTKLVIYNGSFGGFESQEVLAELEDPANELFFGANNSVEMISINDDLWIAAKREIDDIAESIQASVRYYDTPQRDVSRFGIGIASLLFKRGSDSILVFRATTTDGDFQNVYNMVTHPIIDTKSTLSGTKMLERNWKRAGLEWGKDQIDREKEPDWYYQVVMPLYSKILQRGFGEELSDAVDGQQVGGDGDVISLTEEEAIQEGYWPVVKTTIEQIRKDLPNEGRILFSGHSQGGSHAEMARMYTEKIYGETWPVVTFASTGAACFPRKLFGIGRTDYLDDVDPTKYYVNVTNYNMFLDPLGGGLGESIGDDCYLGKYDIENNLQMSSQYRYCSRIYGYSFLRITADEELGFDPLRIDSKLCRFVAHQMYFIMKELERDEELNEDGSTLGGCFPYEGASLESGQCPEVPGGPIRTTVLFVPAVLFLLGRLALSNIF